MPDGGNNLADHLTALRKTVLLILLGTAVLCPFGYWASSYVIRFLVWWSFPENAPALHYFSPMEVFLVQLKLALVLALVAGYPWNIVQIWRFLKPALYPNERSAFRLWIAGISVLFFAGVVFCIGLILPLLMNFSASFANAQVRPVIGLAAFLDLAGWLMLAFGIMFQAPVIVLVAVRFGLISVESLRSKRPYVVVGILILSALLTPPDVVSQLMLAVPTWLLFEFGLLLAGRVGAKSDTTQNPGENQNA